MVWVVTEGEKERSNDFRQRGVVSGVNALAHDGRVV